MKYEAPELTVLTPAINAVQGTPKATNTFSDGGSGNNNEHVAAYADWE